MLRKYSLIAGAALSLQFISAAWAGHITALSDLEIAQRFSPVVINEMTTDANGKVVASDKIDNVSYDVAQTNDFIYVSYQVLKSWSQNLEIESAIQQGNGWMVTPFLNGAKTTNHPVDAEDVFVVVKKVNNELKLVMFASNAHGKRLIYTVKDNVAAAELDKFEPFNQGFEKPSFISGFFVRPSIQKLQDFSKTAPHIDQHPVLVSTGASHSLVAGRFEMSAITDAMKNGSMKVSTESSVAMPAGVLSSAHVPYKMIPVSSLVSEMTFSPEVLEENFGGKADASKEISISLNGQSVTAPKLPTHIDPIWYLTKYSPSTLNEIQEQLKSPDLGAEKREILERYLAVPEADFSWNHENRINPAAAFKAQFPITAKDENGDYTRYELLKVKAAAYRN